MTALAPNRHTPRHLRWLAAGAAVPLLLGALGACGYGSKSTGSAAPAASADPASGKKLSASTVRIGYFANVTHATALVGLQKGLFQKQLGSTKIDTQVFNAGPSEIEALNAGAVDIGWIGPSPAINGYVKSHGQDLRIIGGSASGGVELVVNPKKIKSLSDLRGKRIATPQLGNTQDVALLNYLASKGYKVDPQSGKGDVTVERVDNKTSPVLFQQGGIDGAWAPEPLASQLVAAGGKVLLNEKSLWPKGTFVITNIIVSQKFLTAHPDVVSAVLRGSVAANAWIKANPAGAKQAINQQLTTLSGKPLPGPVLDSAFADVDVTDDPLAATLRSEADHAVKAGLLDKPDLNGIYDLGPLNKVLTAQGRPALSDAGL